MFTKISKWLPMVSMIFLFACTGGGTDDDDQANSSADDIPSQLDSPDNPSSPQGALQKAVNQEDHTLISEQQLYQGAHSILDALRNGSPVQSANTGYTKPSRKEVINFLYKDITETISWFPSNYSIHLSNTLESDVILAMPGNTNGNGENVRSGLLYTGEKEQHRYAAVAQNIFMINRNTQTEKIAINLINYLTNNSDNNRKLKVLTAQVPSYVDSWYSRHNELMRSWFPSAFPNVQFTPQDDCDYERFLKCIEYYNPDVIVMGGQNRENMSYESIKAAVEKAKELKIPIIVYGYRRGETIITLPIFRYMGVAFADNYNTKMQIKDATVETILNTTDDFLIDKIEKLITDLEQGNFEKSYLGACVKSLLLCQSELFHENFRTAADWVRSSAMSYDEQYLKVFESPDAKLLQILLLLADKYRQQIDYPIDIANGKEWIRAMFADWAVSYSRDKNLAQPDLGEYTAQRKTVRKFESSSYPYPQTLSQQKDFSVLYTNQWTTTGWYALPGQKITFIRLDNSDTKVRIKLNYHRLSTNKAAESQQYFGPAELAQSRITLDKNSTITFSSPYGGPIYVHLVNNQQQPSTKIYAQGIAQHPSITDFSDSQQIATFNEKINATEVPHIDLRSSSAEHHMRKDKFINAIGSERYPDINALLHSISFDHIETLYSLAGYSVQGKTLSESLDPEVLTNCVALFSNQICTDTNIHTRKIIQHANYDEFSVAGSGTSGNPWDASWNVDPLGWGDNHEVGHNLQRARLNVGYVTAENKENVSQYINRATENSNNIFPYYVAWKWHYVTKSKTETLYDGHSNHKQVFAVLMSDIIEAKDSDGNRISYDHKCEPFVKTGDRYTTPWVDDGYAKNNSYRMSFYIQMAFHSDKKALSTGQILQNGFNIYTLLYQHERIFSYYIGSEQLWEANKANIGFSDYSLNDARAINGNQFLLISLGYITGRDWRPYFDMYGLHYTTKAAQQAETNGYREAVATGLYAVSTAIPDATITGNMQFLPINFNDDTTVWPEDGFTPKDCTP